MMWMNAVRGGALIRIYLIAALLALVVTASPVRAERAAEEPFDPIASLYEKGNDYFRKGSYTSAINVFHLVSDNHADHILAPESLFSIASAQHKMGDLAGATKTYDQLMQKYPSSPAIPDALLQLGMVHADMGNPSGAKAVWSRLISEYNGSIAAKIAEQRIGVLQASAVAAPLAPERPAAASPMAAPSKPSPVSAPRDMPPARPYAEMFPSAPVTPPAGPDRFDRNQTFAEIPAQPSADAPGVYVVKKNDSLSAISKKLWGTTDRYTEIAKHNKISPPYTIEIGQVLRIPGAAKASPVVDREPAEWSTATPSREYQPPPERPSPAPSPMPAAPAMPPMPPRGKPAPVPSQPAPWTAAPLDDMEKAAGSIGQWVDNRSEGYDALQKRILELQQDVKAQKLMEKQLEILKNQIVNEQAQNNGLKKELISNVDRLKELKDRNVSLTSQVQAMTDAMDRTKAIQSQNAEMDVQVKAHRARMEALEKQNRTLTETLQKMRDAFDAQMGLVKAYYDSQMVHARRDYEMRMDTTESELARLREDARSKDVRLADIKKDYTELIKKTASIQKEIIEEKQKSVSTTAAKQSLERAKELKRQGKTKEAEASYREALSIYPDYADAMNELAFLYAEEGRNLDEAEKLTERAISVDPEGRGYYLDTLGWIHFARRAYAAAEAALRESHRLIPIDNLPARAAVHYHIGKVYQAMADKDKAFFHFIDAIKLGPRTRWAALSERELDAL